MRGSDFSVQPGPIEHSWLGRDLMSLPRNVSSLGNYHFSPQYRKASFVAISSVNGIKVMLHRHQQRES